MFFSTFLYSLIVWRIWGGGGKMTYKNGEKIVCMRSGSKGAQHSTEIWGRWNSGRQFYSFTLFLCHAIIMRGKRPKPFSLLMEKKTFFAGVLLKCFPLFFCYLYTTPAIWIFIDFSAQQKFIFLWLALQ